METTFFRAINEAPDKLRNLTDTQTSILFRLLYLLPFTGKFCGMSLYRASRIFGRDKTNFSRHVKTIIEWQETTGGIQYFEWNKDKGLRLLIDENDKIGVLKIGGRNTTRVMKYTQVGVNGHPKAGDEIHLNGCNSSPTVRTESNRIEEQNYDQKGSRDFSHLEISTKERIL